jgi:hypothetical protein
MLDLALIAVLAVASFAAILRIGLVPRDPAQGVAVIFTPWTGADETLARSVAAGARFVRFGRLPFIAIVMPERPDYVERAFANSAVLAVDPQILAGCLLGPVSQKADNS